MNRKYCEHGIYLLLLCDIEALQLIIFQVEGFLEVRICSLQVVVGRFLQVEGGFRSFSAHCRSFQVVFCSLKMVSNRLVPIVGRFSFVAGSFRSFRARFWLFLISYRSFEVVPRANMFNTATTQSSANV